MAWRRLVSEGSAHQSPVVCPTFITSGEGVIEVGGNWTGLAQYWRSGKVCPFEQAAYYAKVKEQVARGSKPHKSTLSSSPIVSAHLPPLPPAHILKTICPMSFSSPVAMA